MRNMLKLRKFQEKFISAVEKADADIFCFSLPRGNGKSFLAGHLITRALTPGDSLFVGVGKEVGLVSGSLRQARIVFGFVRQALEPLGGYTFRYSHIGMGCTHDSSGATLVVMTSRSKSMFGIVNMPILVLDEPGSLDVVGGGELWTAIRTSLGKPGSKLKIVITGTVSPAVPGDWWPKMVERGTGGRCMCKLFRLIYPSGISGRR